MKKIMLLAFILIFAIGCSSEKSKDQSSSGSNNTAVNNPGVIQTDKEIQYVPSGIPFDLNGNPLEIAGVRITPASQWQDLGSSGMRNANYTFGPLEQDTDSATVAVYFFGNGQGGDINSNIERWITQMALLDGRDPHTGKIQYTLEVDGMTVHMLSIYGIYKASAGGMMSGQVEEKRNYRMVGSIIEAPGGNVFLKLTGPDYTAKIMIEAYMAMIRNVKKI